MVKTETSELSPIPGMTKKDMEIHTRARKAYKEAMKLRRQWQAIARMMARRPTLRLELSHDVSRTDNKTIFIRVPMELGNDLEHESGLCGRRNAELLQQCAKCAVIEDVNITVIHEVAHMIFGTFEQIPPHEVTKLIEDTVRLECGRLDSSRAQHLLKIVNSLPDEARTQYMGIASTVSQFLPLVINACEDIRVNALMQQERPGTEVLFQAQLNKIFSQGTYAPDGTFVKWIDCPPNAQALIGVYCMTWNLALDGKILPEIQEKLECDSIRNLVNKMQQSKSVRDVYRVAFPLLEELRRLGFMRTPEDLSEEQPQEQDDPEDVESGDDNGQSSESGDSEDKDNDSEHGDSSSSGSGSNSGQDSVSNSSGDDSSGSSGDESQSQASSGAGDSSEKDQVNEELQQDGSSGNSERDTESDNQAPAESAISENSSSTGEPESGSSTVSEDSDFSDNVEEGSTDSELGTGPGDSEDTEEDAGSEESYPSAGGSETDESPQDSTVDGPDSAADGEPNPSTGDDPGDPNSAGKDTDEYTKDDLIRDGLPELVQRLFDIFGGHGDKHIVVIETPEIARDQQGEQEAIEVALVQATVFDRPSKNIDGLNLFKWPKDAGVHAWAEGKSAYYGTRSSTEPIKIPEAILAPALQRLRILFQDNARGKFERNLRAGKINARSLARRVPVNDDRVFQKYRIPGKKDWFVLVGLDCSGSTYASINRADKQIRLDLIKTVAFAKAELLYRLGIPFAVYAHSGGHQTVDIFAIKEPDQPWGKQQKEALFALQPYSANLDGHSLEFYRKVAERQPQTDKLILYYTDGHMPAENYDEELMILQQEIKLCQRLNIHLVGVGVNSDAPSEHGLDTIQIDEMSEVGKVINELRKRLSQ